MHGSLQASSRHEGIASGMPGQLTGVLVCVYIYLFEAESSHSREGSSSRNNMRQQLGVLITAEKKYQ